MCVFKTVAPTVLFILASPFIAHGQRSESSSGEPARGREPKPQQGLTKIREARALVSQNASLLGLVKG
jgi:hypothetical protein